MSMELKCGFLMFIMVLACFLAKSQHINIETSGGQVITEALASVDNITLPNENLVIHFFNSPPATISLYTIGKIYFDLETSSGQKRKVDKSIPYILANPVMSELKIMNLPERETTAGIYSLQGKLLFETFVSSANSRLDIQNLAGGLYVLKLDGVTLKFVKK